MRQGDVARQPAAPILVGTAGWSIPSRTADQFPAMGSALERYGGRLSAVEINSSFHRPHRIATYARWAAAVPEHFRFAAKLPKVITHEKRLRDCGADLDRFLGEVEGLGAKLAVLLVQLPPSFAFDAEAVAAFFAALRARTPAALVCEPRHSTWFTPEADALLAGLQVSRVAAHPAPVPEAAEPGGCRTLAYLRLHGAPRIYWSDYDAAALAGVGARVAALAATGVPVWCIFDNTAAGHALGNALAVVEGRGQQGLNQ